MTCAISPDDQFLVTGGDDTAINVWRLDSLELVKGYPKLHRAAVTALTFKKCTSPSMELYSGSDDKAIKVGFRGIRAVDKVYQEQDELQKVQNMSLTMAN